MDHVLNVPGPRASPRRHAMPLSPSQSKPLAGTSTSSVRTELPRTTSFGLSLSKPLAGTSAGSVRTEAAGTIPSLALRRYRAMEHTA
jgi:hypothetical protein